MKNQDFNLTRNGIQPELVLKAFGITHTLSSKGQGSRNSKRYRDIQQIIHRFIGTYSSKTNRYCSTLGQYSKFAQWAYRKLGYSYHQLGNVWGWWNDTDVSVWKQKQQLEAQARNQLPHWCHTPWEIAKKVEQLA